MFVFQRQCEAVYDAAQQYINYLKTHATNTHTHDRLAASMPDSDKISFIQKMLIKKDECQKYSENRKDTLKTRQFSTAKCQSILFCGRREFGLTMTLTFDL